MKIIHVTERQQFKACRRAWNYSYKEGLQRPFDHMDARWFGKGAHVALAAFHSQDLRGWPVAFEAWLEAKIDEHAKVMPLNPEDYRKVEELKTLLEGMMDGYNDFAEANDDFTVLGVEVPLSVKVPGTNVILAGTVDMIVRRKGKLWVVDHKTYASFADPEALLLDDQMTAYLWMVWKTYGEMPAGAIYNQLRKKLPATPMLLKDGKRLSQDKSIDTTREVYLQAIHDNGFNEADYADILEKIGLNEFFRRETIPRNQNELLSFEENLVPEAREMTSKSTFLYPNATRDCVYCDYRTICKAQNERGDVDSLKANLFVVEHGRRI